MLNEEDNLTELHDRLQSSLADVAGGYEVIYVDDGSQDRSAELVRAWIAADEPARLVKLSRNFGMEIAMSAGIDHVRGSYTVLMHADLQDPPELIPDMLDSARDEQADVGFARPRGGGARCVSPPPHRARREPHQATAGDGLLRDDALAGARALPGPGGRLPA